MVLGSLGSLDRGRLGLLTAALVVAVLTLAFSVSAATAPSRGVVGQTDSRTLVGVHGGGTGLHEFGSVELHDEQGEAIWKIENADSYFDVTRTDDGRILAGFMDGGYTECGPYASPCYHTGFRVLDPNASEPTVEEFAFPVRTKRNSEVHDVERLPSGEYLVTDMDQEQIFTIAANGTRTWSWQASEFYTPPDDPTRRDWLHINDVDVIGEDRYLVSVRNANQLVVVERGQGVVDVVNEDRTSENDGSCKRYGQQLVGEDPRCGDPEVMDHQHNPQWLGENAVLVADSDNNRIVELHRNGSDGEWTVAWELREANGIEFRWPRDADRLQNGNTLITDSLNQRVVEVNQSGRVVWSSSFDGVVPYEAERLPEGERVGAQLYNPSPGVVGGASAGLPVFSDLLFVLQTSLPVPFWLTEWHLVALVIGVVVAAVGLVVWWRDRDTSAPVTVESVEEDL
jgi:hypothetical protein